MTATKSRPSFTSLIAWAAVLALLLGLLPVSASAAEYTASGATSFVFSDSGITISEGDYSGYKTDGTELTINGSGTYIVSGSCSDGSIKIKKGTTGVTLVLNGLTLTSTTTAPISCNKSTGVNIVVAAGTTNTLTDNAYNNDDNYPDNENAENAVIKCKDGSQVVISGSGTLNITANGKNGIKSGATTDDEGAASLTIRDVTLNITASVNDAINAEQLLNVESGTITITAVDDAIHCDYELNIGATGTTGPTIVIEDCEEGIEGATLNIYSGDIFIQANDDCLNAANSDLAGYAFSMNISGGTITAYSATGDGFDSNGSLTISGGTVAVWTASAADNQPLDADGIITISGGTVLAAGGGNGMGTNISATQAYVVYGSTGGMGGGQMPGGMGEGQSPDGQTGAFGNQGGRPDDQVGGLGGQTGDPGNQSGGFGGQNGGPFGQQDGNAGMPGDSTSVSISKGSSFSIQDASGNTLYSGTAPCDIGYMLFSSSTLTSGSSYTLSSGGSEVATATAQTGSVSGGQAGGQPGNSGGQTPSGAQAPDGSAFTDVTSGAYYYDAVKWAVENSITAGTGNGTTFSPDLGCTRAQVVTFLWRAAGSPAPKAASNPFTDISSNAYYYEAVLWAVENGVTAGTSNTTFSPDNTCTRGQIVTFLYRAVGTSAAGSNPFTDVTNSAYYANAVKWAVTKSITSGTTATTFSPDQICTRAQIVTFLYRAYAN